jgi:hypothetical protein
MVSCLKTLSQQAVVAQLVVSASAYNTRMDQAENIPIDKIATLSEHVTAKHFKPSMRQRFSHLHQKDKFRVGPVCLPTRLAFKRSKKTSSPTATHLAKHFCAQGRQAAIDCFRQLVAKVHKTLFTAYSPQPYTQFVSALKVNQPVDNFSAGVQDDVAVQQGALETMLSMLEHPFLASIFGG